MDPVVEVSIEKGETIRAETGSMLYMTDGITMETSTGSGMMAGLKRAVTGDSFFITDFTYNGNGQSGTVAFSSHFPAKVGPLVSLSLCVVVC